MRVCNILAGLMFSVLSEIRPKGQMRKMRTAYDALYGSDEGFIILRLHEPE